MLTRLVSGLAWRPPRLTRHFPRCVQRTSSYQPVLSLSRRQLRKAPTDSYKLQLRSSGFGSEEAKELLVPPTDENDIG
jgi:hypothetical protein